MWRILTVRTQGEDGVSTLHNGYVWQVRGSEPVRRIFDLKLEVIMARKSKVWNKSTGLKEHAERKLCPRCKGDGGLNPEDGGWDCWLCGGKGRIWISESGWCRRIGAKGHNSVLY